MRMFLLVSALAGALACGSTPKPENPEPGEPTAETPAEGPVTAERPEMTVEECEAKGTVVGDIGDGAVHRPEYRCPDGAVPIGTVPLGIEGSVCCPS